MKIVLLDECTKVYGEKVIVSNLTFSFCKGIYFLKGSNGSGKSVLLRCITSLEKFSSGRFQSNAKNILYLTDQHLNYNYLTIQENISLLYDIHNLKLHHEEKKIVDSLYTTSQLNTISEKASLGMKLKVGCSLLAKEDYWDLVILDETLSSIDYNSRKIILSLCEKLVHTNTCIIIVSHNDIEKEYLYNKNIIELSEGRLIDYDDSKY